MSNFEIPIEKIDFNHMTKKTDLEKQVESMVEYLLLKVAAKDWHGVADAAMDIRELETQIRLLKELGNG